VTDIPRIAAEPLQDFAARAFAAVGMPQPNAVKAAALMVRADLRGSDTHGVFRLPTYIKRIRAGGIEPNASIRVVSDKPAAALVDGGNGMGHLVMSRAADIAIQKAKACGVGWVGARMSNHAGPAALYAMMPLAHDMIGIYLAVGSSNHLPPWGGRELLLGTNPLAIAVPAAEEPPVVLDMAPTVAAFGKVRLKAQRGEPMPVGWMIDAEGKPLTDAKRADEGFLLPIGEYKGYGLSLMIGLLAGVLNGAAFGRDVVDWIKQPDAVNNTGHAVVAVSLAAFGEAQAIKHQVDAAVREIRGSARLPGVERILLPGEQSHATFNERSARGIPMPKPLQASLDAMAAEIGIAPLARATAQVSA
jgi:LDH2 family malate/lactate/ureidoglycolate dehydrogenase